MWGMLTLPLRFWKWCWYCVSCEVTWYKNWRLQLTILLILPVRKKLYTCGVCIIVTNTLNYPGYVRLILQRNSVAARRVSAFIFYFWVGFNEILRSDVQVTFNFFMPKPKALFSLYISAYEYCPCCNDVPSCFSHPPWLPVATHNRVV